MASHQLYPANLDYSKPEIRLIEIIDDTENENVSCRLHTVPLDGNSPLTALSYVWGDSNAKAEITVNDTKLAITTNLAVALKHARKHWIYEFPDRDPTTFRIWADAICINQSDATERSEQVKLMPQIYSKAELVLGWLGDRHEEDITVAVETIDIILTALKSVGDDMGKLRRLEWLRHYPALTESPECDRRWNSLKVLGGLPYWKRVWILQENLLATTMFYVTPNSLIEASTLLNACMGLGVLSDTLVNSHVPKPEFIPTHVWVMLSPPEGTFFIGLREIQRLGSAKFTLREIESNNPGTERILWENLHLSQYGGLLEATDPKDHIYGLLGISRLDIEVDYSQATQISDVYIDYCRVVLQCMQRLQRREIFFLRDAGIGVYDNNVLDLPSWAPNYPARSTGEPTLIFREDFSLSTIASDLPLPSISSSELSISGICLQTVKRLMPSPPTLENVRKGGQGFAWIEEYIRRNPMYDTLPTTWVLFLVASRMPKFVFDTPNMLLLQQFVRALDHEMPKHPLEKGQILSQSKTIEEGGISIGVFTDSARSNPSMMTYVSPELSYKNPSQALADKIKETKYRLLHILKCNYHTKIFETGEELLGMGPQHCAEGDMVCLVDGYSDLVLLRKCRDRYRFVGPCMTFGIRQDEIKKALDQESLKVESFRLI